MLRCKILFYPLVYPLIGMMIAGCAGGENTVPLTAPAPIGTPQQTDPAAADAELQQARIDALRQRMLALQSESAATVTGAADATEAPLDTPLNDPLNAPVADAPLTGLREEVPIEATALVVDDSTAAAQALAAQAVAAINANQQALVEKAAARPDEAAPTPEPASAQAENTPAALAPTALAPAEQATLTGAGSVVLPEMAPTVPPTVSTSPPRVAASGLAPIVLKRPSQPTPTVAQPAGPTEVFFKNGSAVLTAADRQKIRRWAKQLPATGPLLIEGYASPNVPPSARGDMVNLRLSLARAAAVRDVLVAAGVDPARLELRGQSDRNPRGFAEIKRRAVVYGQPTVVWWPGE